MRGNPDSKVWTVEIRLEETTDETQARAVAFVGDAEIGGWGRAKRSPDDPALPRVGEELATARALSDLAHHLFEDAVATIEAREGRPVSVHL